MKHPLIFSPAFFILPRCKSAEIKKNYSNWAIKTPVNFRAGLF